MPLIKITPKVETESAQFYELEGRRFAIVKVDPDVGREVMEEAHRTISQFLDMDVLFLTFDATVEIVEAPPQTWLERVGSDD